MLRAVATRVLLLLVCACALAGCGESGPTDEERIRSTLAAFERATADRDYQALCTRILAPKLVETVKQIGLPCEVALEKGFEGVSEPRISVGADRPCDGTRPRPRSARAPRARSRARTPSSCVKVGDDWRIASLAGAGDPLSASGDTQQGWGRGTPDGGVRRGPGGSVHEPEPHASA